MSFINGKYMKTAVVVWGICLVVFVLAFMFVLRPQIAEKSNLDRKYEIAKENDETYNEQAKESTKREMQEQIDEMKAQLARFVLPSRDAIQTLASIEIDKMAKDLGLDAYIDPWNGSQIAAFSECKHVYGQSIKVTFNATFNEFAKFLNRLERYKSVIFIDSFSITRSHEENVKHTVEMNLVVLVEKPATAKNVKS